jgi:hypothetical protein
MASVVVNSAAASLATHMLPWRSHLPPARGFGPGMIRLGGGAVEFSVGGQGRGEWAVGGCLMRLRGGQISDSSSDDDDDDDDDDDELSDVQSDSFTSDENADKRL